MYKRVIIKDYKRVIIKDGNNNPKYPKYKFGISEPPFYFYVPIIKANEPVRVHKPLNIQVKIL